VVWWRIIWWKEWYYSPAKDEDFWAEDFCKGYEENDPIFLRIMKILKKNMNEHIMFYSSSWPPKKKLRSMYEETTVQRSCPNIKKKS